MLHASTTLVSELVMLLALLLFGMRTDKIMLMDSIYRWKIHTCCGIPYYYRLLCTGRVTELPIALRVFEAELPKACTWKSS